MMIGAEHAARFLAAGIEAAIELRLGVFFDGAETYELMH